MRCPTSSSLGRLSALLCAGCLGGALACSGGSSASDAAPALQADGGPDGSHIDATAVAADSGPEASPPGPNDAQSDADATAAADVATSDAAEAGPDDAGEASEASEASDANGCTLGSSGEPTDLGCTGLYSDWASKAVSPDVHEYDPGLHLWSDGAVKTRWIYLPPGDAGGRQPIDTTDMDEWTFPVGTKFWKEFALAGKRVETRLLWKQGPYAWYRTTYLWSPDESSATELTTGELDADGNGYEVPTQTECLDCHNGRMDDVLGFEAVSLSSANAALETIQTLAAQGWITTPPEAGIFIPGNAADVAALGYLHMNCGVSCHNRGNGRAEPTGFFMRLEVGRMGSVQATDTWQTGVNQPSNISPPGAASALALLAPGEAGASCVYYRMAHRTGLDEAGSGIQMPPIDTHKVDEAGVSLVEGWINQGCQ